MFPPLKFQRGFIITNGGNFQKLSDMTSFLLARCAPKTLEKTMLLTSFCSGRPSFSIVQEPFSHLFSTFHFFLFFWSLALSYGPARQLHSKVVAGLGNKFIKDFPENCRFSTMKKICATLVAKSTQGNHFIFFVRYGPSYNIRPLLNKTLITCKTKKFFWWRKKNSRYFSIYKDFSGPP